MEIIFWAAILVLIIALLVFGLIRNLRRDLRWRK